MSLTVEEIRILARELEGALEGSRVENFRRRDEESFFLALRGADRTRRFLLLSTRPRVCRFHLVAARPGAAREPGPFAEAVRSRIRGARLTAFRQVGGDRVVEWTFTRRRSEAGEAPGEDITRLVLEIRGGRGHLALLGEKGELAATLHPLHRGGREMRPGMPYRFPKGRAEHGAVKALLENPWRFVEEGDRGGKGHEFPFHASIEERYAGLEAREILDERRGALESSLRREVDRRSRAVEKVRQDLLGARRGEECRKKGELLKGAFHRLERGMESIEVEDYFTPGMEKIEVALDPALGPQQNVERYFKRYRKCRRAVPILEERLSLLQEGLERCRQLLEAVRAADSLSALDALEEDAAAICRRRRPAVKPQRAPEGRSGPRRFLSSEGFEILVGRNARGNDDLTLRIGRGNDLFLHMAGSPGAHVVVRAKPGKTVPLETLLDAALLAVYYSLPERSRGAASAGMKAEVDYTPLKYVRKPKGLKPGAVLLSSHKTLRVQVDPDRLDRLRRSTGQG